MISNLKCIVEAEGEGWANYEDNQWNGIDVHLDKGGTLRIARKGGEGEDIEVFMFDNRMLLLWRAAFSASAPVPVVAAAVRAACSGEAGG